MGGFDSTATGISKETGINKDRKCTDFLCLLVFLAFVASLFACAFYGIKHGDPKRMIAPYDGDGNFCGLDNTATGGKNMEDYSKLYFTTLQPTATSDITKSIFRSAVCAKSCPDTNDVIECVSTYYHDCVAG